MLLALADTATSASARTDLTGICSSFRFARVFRLLPGKTITPWWEQRPDDGQAAADANCHGGLPATGKTTIARDLARQLGAVYLRIDSIEQAIRASGAASHPLNDAGYLVAYAVAEDNLRIGRTVIADSVNPLQLTRDAWVEVAKRAQVNVVEIEVKYSDVSEHRHRVETRSTDIPGLRLPSWDEVVSREYHPWGREHLVIETAGQTVEQTVRTLREVLPGR